MTDDDKSIEVAFGKAMRHLRDERGFSQQGMADLCGRSRMYISKIERGVQSPTLGTIDSLCAALDVSLEELVMMLRRYGYRK